MSRPKLVYVALGSNLGSRRRYLEAAIERLDRLPQTRVEKRSFIYETEPEGPLPPGAGGSGDGRRNRYLNMVVELSTGLGADELLDGLLEIEESLGRVRPAPRNADRTIDLDVLLFGDEVIDEPRLVVPHPRLQEREFVLRPLADIAPSLLHPTLCLSVEQLLDRLSRHTARRISRGGP